MMSAAVLAITNPKPKKQKTTKTLIVEGGIWKPFYIWPKREKISEARKKYHEASELFDDLQLEAERTKASLEFLCAQVADGAARADRGKAAVVVEGENAAKVE
jgi:microsomal dipeptidase-like Zn-dependent dipeptidase